MVSILLMKQRTTDETFAEFVKRTREEKRLSLNDVAANSKRKGKGISNAYVSKIENGQQTNVTPRMLRALADGLQIPYDLLEAKYRGLDPEERREIREALLNAMLYDFEKLNDKDQKHLFPYLEMVYKQIKERLPE